MLTPKRFRGRRTTPRACLYAGDIGSHGDEVRRLFRDSQVGGSGLGYLYQLAVLVMGGDVDPIVPVANARILAGLIPNATLHVFTGGHVEPLAAARDFGPVISRFVLREQPSHRASGRADIE